MRPLDLSHQARAFIGYALHIETPFNLVAEYKQGTSIAKIAIEMDITESEAKKKIKELIANGTVQEREPHHHHTAEIKAKAVQMLNKGFSQKETADWIYEETGIQTNYSLISKWRHQEPVKEALQKLHDKQQAKQTKH